MSNRAGKALAMTAITPIATAQVKWSKIAFSIVSPSGIFSFMNWLTKKLGREFDFSRKLDGLRTLSILHHGRWVIVTPNDWPYLGGGQAREKVKYAYQFFLGNLDGTKEDVLETLTAVFPEGLAGLWHGSVGLDKWRPATFVRYIERSDVWMDHFYSAYPLASVSDVTAAVRLKAELGEFIDVSEQMSPEEFQSAYDALLNSLQGSVRGDVESDAFPCLGELGPAPGE